MSRVFRLVPLRSLVSVIIAASPLGLVAQSTARTGAPVSGTWAGEATIGEGFGSSAALLLFRSPTWALRAAASITSSSVDQGIGQERRLTSTALRVGARRYARSGLGLRPIAGLGLEVFDQGFGGTSVGAYGEYGAVYFFNPHVSLGATGEIRAFSRDGGGSSFSASLARLIGTVYF
jgi:hypothetical protein